MKINDNLSDSPHGRSNANRMNINLMLISRNPFAALKKAWKRERGGEGGAGMSFFIDFIGFIGFTKVFIGFLLVSIGFYWFIGLADWFQTNKPIKTNRDQ